MMSLKRWLWSTAVLGLVGGVMAFPVVSFEILPPLPTGPVLCGLAFLVGVAGAVLVEPSGRWIGALLGPLILLGLGLLLFLTTFVVLALLSAGHLPPYG